MQVEGLFESLLNKSFGGEKNGKDAAQNEI